MAEPPNPPVKGKLPGRLGKFPPWVYVMLAAGVAVTVVYMRRQSAPATVPSTDPTYPVETPDAAVGSYQGYDSPQDNSISGRDILEFTLATRDQNLAIRDQDVAIREQDLSVLASRFDSQYANTGGGLPSDPIPNPAPAPRRAAPKPAKRAVKTCHKAYNGKEGNCRTVTITHYSDGSQRQSGDHRLRWGKCHKTGTKCSKRGK